MASLKPRLGQLNVISQINSPADRAEEWVEGDLTIFFYLYLRKYLPVSIFAINVLQRQRVMVCWKNRLVTALAIWYCAVLVRLLWPLGLANVTCILQCCI